MANSTGVSNGMPRSICARCGVPIRRQWALRVGDRLYHTRCQNYTTQFFHGILSASSQCNKQDSVCSECQESVTDITCMSIGDRIYHEKCLKCAICQQPFSPTKCVFQVDNKNRCSDCQLTKLLNESQQKEEKSKSDQFDE